MRRHLAFLLCLMVMPSAASGGVFDEFQVFDGKITEPGSFDLNQHVNIGRRGRSGEGAPRNGVLSTTEIGYATRPWHEVAVYIPVLQEFSGGTFGGGFKLRNTFVQPGAADRPLAMGFDIELHHQPSRFSDSRWAVTLRPILDFRSGRWQLILNPSIEVPFGGGDVVFAPAVRGVVRVAEQVWIGLENYMDFGRVDHWETPRRQAHQLFATVDTRLTERVGLHLGVGRGLTNASEAWAGKLIISVDF